MGLEAGLRVQTVGTGPKQLAFLHGLMGRGKNFMAAAKALRDDFTSTLIDLPNHGESAWTDTFSYLDMVQAIEPVLAELTAKVGPVNLLGHSMGGKVAMLTALSHPALINRLIVEDVSPVSSGESAEFVHLLGSLKKLNLSQLTTRQEASELLKPAIPNERTRGFLLQNLRHTSAGYEWQVNLDLLFASLQSIGDFPLAELQNQRGTDVHFDSPVLWMAGENSEYITNEYEPAMRKLFPRTRRATVKNASHWIHSEQPEAFVAALRAFLID